MNQDVDSASRGDWELPSDLKPLEAKLATLRPRQDRLDRERLIFLAGRASAPAARRWPVAFAAMTAVAATLLGLLVARPVVVEVQSLPAGLRAQTDSTLDPFGTSFLPLATDLRDRRAVLSTRDSYHHDIEQLLARGDWPSTDANVTTETTSAEDRDRAILTPSTWRQLLEGREFVRPSSTESSNQLQYRGINS